MDVLTRIYLACLLMTVLVVGAINAQTDKPRYTSTPPPAQDWPINMPGMASHGNTLGGHVMYTALILVPILHVLLRKLAVV